MLAFQIQTRVLMRLEWPVVGGQLPPVVVLRWVLCGENAQRGAVGVLLAFLWECLGCWPCLGHSCFVLMVAALAGMVYFEQKATPPLLLLFRSCHPTGILFGVCLDCSGTPMNPNCGVLVGLGHAATRCISCCVQWVLQLMHLLACVALFGVHVQQGITAHRFCETQSVEVNLWSGHKGEHSRFLWTSTNSPNG